METMSRREQLEKAVAALEDVSEVEWGQAGEKFAHLRTIVDVGLAATKARAEKRAQRESIRKLVSSDAQCVEMLDRGATTMEVMTQFAENMGARMESAQ